MRRLVKILERRIAELDAKAAATDSPTMKAGYAQARVELRATIIELQSGPFPKRTTDSYATTGEG
jgi:hypothetical protein